MSLNLKYRPKNFKDFYGNKSVIRSLESMINNENRHHALLFYGPSGCGKTTLARIVSSQLGCKEFDTAEIDMGSNRGIDTARQIIEKIHLRPLGGKVKVYILDEVHKTTNEFQNALLKNLEEPPSFVYFILCTTDPNKLLKTILNRCMSFELKSFSDNAMEKLLNEIIEKEKIKLSEKVVNSIIKNANGSPRIALVTLNKVKDIEDEKHQLQSIQGIDEDNKNVIDLCRLFMKDSIDWSEITDILKQITDDPETVRRIILKYFTKVIINKPIPRIAFIIDCFKDNYYDSGDAGLLLSCYAVCFFKKN